MAKRLAAQRHVERPTTQSTRAAEQPMMTHTFWRNKSRSVAHTDLRNSSSTTRTLPVFSEAVTAEGSKPCAAATAEVAGARAKESCGADSVVMVPAMACAADMVAATMFSATLHAAGLAPCGMAMTGASSTSSSRRAACASPAGAPPSSTRRRPPLSPLRNSSLPSVMYAAPLTGSLALNSVSMPVLYSRIAAIKTSDESTPATAAQAARNDNAMLTLDSTSVVAGPMLNVSCTAGCITVTVVSVCPVEGDRDGEALSDLGSADKDGTADAEATTLLPAVALLLTKGATRVGVGDRDGDTVGEVDGLAPVDKLAVGVVAALGVPLLVSVRLAVPDIVGVSDTVLLPVAEGVSDGVPLMLMLTVVVELTVPVVLLEGVNVGVTEGLAPLDSVAVGVDAALGVPLLVLVPLVVAEGVSDSDAVPLREPVGVGDAVLLRVPVMLLDGVAEGVTDGVAPGDSVAVGVEAALGVPLFVGEPVAVGVIELESVDVEDAELSADELKLPVALASDDAKALADSEATAEDVPHRVVEACALGLSEASSEKLLLSELRALDETAAVGDVELTKLGAPEND